MDKHLSSTEEPEKKVVTIKKSTAKPRTTRKLSKNRSQEYEDLEEESPKKRNANKLFQFYIPMELSKREFLEDYVFDN